MAAHVIDYASTHTACKAELILLNKNPAFVECNLHTDLLQMLGQHSTPKDESPESHRPFRSLARRACSGWIMKVSRWPSSKADLDGTFLEAVHRNGSADMPDSSPVSTL